MGIETSAEHGGSEMSFMAAILAVEGSSPRPPPDPPYEIGRLWDRD